MLLCITDRSYSAKISLSYSPVTQRKKLFVLVSLWYILIKNNYSPHMQCIFFRQQELFVIPHFGHLSQSTPTCIFISTQLFLA